MRVWGLFALGFSLMLCATRNDGQAQSHPLTERTIDAIRAGGSCESSTDLDDGCQRCVPRGEYYLKCDADTTKSTTCFGFTHLTHCDDVPVVHYCNGNADYYDNNLCRGSPNGMTDICFGNAYRVTLMPTDPIICTGY